MRRDLVIVANVGDSRAVLSRAGGRAVDLSAEHRVYGKQPAALAEIERVEGVGGGVDDGRGCGVLAVSRCGCFFSVRVWWGAGGRDASDSSPGVHAVLSCESPKSVGVCTH